MFSWRVLKVISRPVECLFYRSRNNADSATPTFYEIHQE